MATLTTFEGTNEQERFSGVDTFRDVILAEKGGGYMFSLPVAIKGKTLDTFGSLFRVFKLGRV